MVTLRSRAQSRASTSIDEIIAKRGATKATRRAACPLRRAAEAIAAVHVLRADVDSPTRVVEPGQDVIERDEEWARACRQAIEAIVDSA